MEYKDFIWIDADMRRVDFLSYLAWLMEDDFARLENHLKDALGIKKLPKRTVEEIIEGIILTSEREFHKKAGSSNFYICHALCVLDVVRRIFTRELYEALEKAASDARTRFLANQYRDILRWVLLDVEDLCSLYACTVNHDARYSSSYRKNHIQTASVHQVLRQGLYGTASFHSHADKEISASIGTIRQLIELRIRRSFGVMAYTDRQGNLYPLDLSQLFGVLKKYRGDIHFPIKLENLIRIYKWANAFIHSGVKDYSWVPYYLEFELRGLSFGRKKGRSWNVNNGISTTQETIDAIHADLTRQRNEQPRNALCGLLHRLTAPLHRLSRGGCGADGAAGKYRLLTCKVECELTD